MDGNLTMQNCYVRDIGDYLKLGILRGLSPGYCLVLRGGYSLTRATIKTGGM